MHTRSLGQKGLETLLVAGVLLNILVPVSGAPVPAADPTMNRDSKPKWINPCGFPSTLPATEQQVPDANLISSILYQTNTALTRGKKFANEYTETTFRMNLNDTNKYYKDYRYDTWLPTRDHIPKSLGEQTPDEHLMQLKLDETLLDIYGYFQRIAVGLEQIVWDEQRNNGEFKNGFADTADNLRSVLCEIQMMMYERNMKMREDVPRDVMPEEIRALDITNSNIRNWVILRDYINLLEYTIEAFDYLKATV